jgi:hypothetical protein
MDTLEETPLPYYKDCVIELTQEMMICHPMLKVGVRGVITGKMSEYLYGFYVVRFVDAGLQEVSRSFMKPVKDEDYIARNVVFQEEYRRRIQSAFHVLHVTNTGGGFSYLTYEFKDKITRKTKSKTEVDQEVAEVTLHNMKLLGVKVDVLVE